MTGASCFICALVLHYFFFLQQIISHSHSSPCARRTSAKCCHLRSASAHVFVRKKNKRTTTWWYVHLEMLCVRACVISIRIAHPCWIMQVSRRKWSLLPLGSIMAAWVKVFSDTKSNALNFKWDFGGGLKRRGESVKGFTPLFTPPRPPLLLHPFFFFLSLSLLSTFSKSIYILTPGCRGILSCCYATWMSSRMSEWWQSANIQKQNGVSSYWKARKGENTRGNKRHESVSTIKSM